MNNKLVTFPSRTLQNPNPRELWVCFFFSFSLRKSKFWTKLPGAVRPQLRVTWLRSFGVIRIPISDPRSVWIMLHQRNRWIYDQSGFVGSFDAPWPSRSHPRRPRGYELGWCDIFGRATFLARKVISRAEDLEINFRPNNVARPKISHRPD